jgi:hypothetical protein
MNGLLAKEHSCGRGPRKFRHNKLLNWCVGVGLGWRNFR